MIDKKDYARFSKFVSVSSENCWLWTGCVDGKGYGMFRVGGRHGHLEKAHRISYEAYNGELPTGVQVLHSCDNPSCVNPEHLRAGNNSDNQIDRFKRGKRIGAITENEARGIKGCLRLTTLTHKEIANTIGIKKSVVADISSGRTWSWV